MSNSTSPRYGWQFDVSIGIDAVFTIVDLIRIFCTIPVHCWVITTLCLKPHVINRDIRVAYVADQIMMLLYGLTMSFFFRPYPIFPWPGYYCAGIICQYGSLDDHMISDSGSSAQTFHQPVEKIRLCRIVICATFFSVIPFFCYLLMRLHNKVTLGSTNWIKSTRAQTCVMSSICIISICNVIGLGCFFVNAENYEQLMQAPELAALASRNGAIILLEKPGESGKFLYEFALLFFTNISIVTFIAFLTVHSMIIRTFHPCYLSFLGISPTLIETHQVQDRLAIVFFSQLIAVGLFFVIPQLSMMTLIVIDISAYPDALLSFLRPMFIIALSLKPLVQSLIYQGKNPDLRKRSFTLMKNLMCFYVPSVKDVRQELFKMIKIGDTSSNISLSTMTR